MITVFYAWQSDLPNKDNRNFIQNSLTKAIGEINRDVAIELEVRFDKDTQGVTGSPDVSRVIFDKIENSQIFVGDITIVAKNRKRSFPNPNVLIEYGYALRRLGWENVIGVLNTAYGKVETLPFDLRQRRPLTYARRDAKQTSDDLSSSLKSAIQAILSRSDALEKRSRNQTLRDLIDELEDGWHILDATNVNNMTTFDLTKYNAAKEVGLDGMITPELYAWLRVLYVKFRQMNTLISKLQGDGHRDVFTVDNLQRLREEVKNRKMIEDAVTQLAALVE